jgi:hypothetical protein
MRAVSIKATPRDFQNTSLHKLRTRITPCASETQTMNPIVQILDGRIIVADDRERHMSKSVVADYRVSRREHCNFGLGLTLSAPTPRR